MRYLLVFLFLGVSTPAWSASYTIDSRGIDREVTGLTGTGILLGQVEEGRSSLWNYDSPSLSVKNLFPSGIYVAGMGGQPPANFGVTDDGHASHVAGVMIAKDMPHYLHVGVAPNAQLHSIADPLSDPVDIALALKRMAEVSGGDVQAINLSFIFELQPFIEAPDGNSHLTQFVDWSARRHDVLYVAGWGNADSVESRAPQDNFNGITIAASEYLDAQDNMYRRFSPQVNAADGDAIGDRTSIDLLAPGAQVRILGYNDSDEFYAGTSIATPHATGAVALLHEYRLQQINANNQRFLANPHRHEVMKAVMLNSADKESAKNNFRI